MKASRKSPGTCVDVYKNRLVACFGVSVLAFGRSLFFLSLPHPERLHRRYLKMSPVTILEGAHHFVASNNTFNSADTVSRMVIVSMYR